MSARIMIVINMHSVLLYAIRYCALLCAAVCLLMLVLHHGNKCCINMGGNEVYAQITMSRALCNAIVR